MTKRSLLSLFIAGFLALQLGGPLSYYLGEDRHDERFAWRMFSTVRLTHCKTSAFDIDEAGQPERVRLRALVHEAWITNMKRNRKRVIQRFTQRRCEDVSVHQSRVRNVCKDPEGSLSQHTYLANCESGDFEHREAQR